MTRTGRNAGDTGAFPARNFLLDEGTISGRAQTYDDVGCVADHASYADWQESHGRYLSDRVFRSLADHSQLKHIDIGDEATCPETFRFLDPSSPFLSTHEDIDLVRVEKVRFIASQSGTDEADVRSLADTVSSHHATSGREYDQLDSVLLKWIGGSQARPVFAAFWNEVKDILGDHAPADWAD